MAVVAVATAERALEITLDYVRNRNAFGRPIGSFQAFQHSCAEIAMERQLAIQLAARAAATGALRDALRARAFNGAAAGRAATRAVQLQGGRGFLDSSEVSRLFRAAKDGELRWGSVDSALRQANP